MGGKTEIMGQIIRHLLQIAGIIFDLIGLGGVSDDLTKWNEWLSNIHTATNEPYIYLPLFIIGNFLLALTWSYWLADLRIRKAGGSSGREFPAHFPNWDKVQNIAVWQSAWLWNGLEPQEGKSEGTPAYATFQRLKEDLGQGKIRNAEKIESSWMWTRLNRQQLIDYALSINERPQFLFPCERKLALMRFLTRLTRRTVPYHQFKSYRGLFELSYHLLPNGYSDEDMKILKEGILRDLRRGEIKVIGRRKENQLLWEYEKIPFYKWWGLKFTSFDRAEGKMGTYNDLRLITKNR